MVRSLLTVFFFLNGILVIAQHVSSGPDSIVQGVIRVRRPLEPAKFHVRVSDVYDYSGDKTRISKINSQVIVMSDSTPGVLPAQPFIQRVSDSTVVQDAQLKKVLCEQYPQDAFDWNGWLSTLDYGYQWNDSTRSDSAQFLFNISSKGEVTVTPQPWKKGDNSSKAFEKIVGTKMLVCQYWYPARISTGKKKKPTKNIGSTVLVTVYAEDAMAGRLKPLNVIVDKPK